MCPLRSLVGGLLSGGLLDIDEPGWSLKGSRLTRARQLPATLLLNKQRHVSPLFYNNAHMENANGWDVLVCCVCAWLFISLPLSVFLCVSLCLCSLCVCMFEWLTSLSCPGNVCGAPLPSCRPPTVMHWSDTTDASAQPLVNTGRHKFWRRDKNKPRYRRRDTKGQPDSTLSPGGERTKGERRRWLQLLQFDRFITWISWSRPISHQMQYYAEYQSYLLQRLFETPPLL